MQETDVATKLHNFLDQLSLENLQSTKFIISRLCSLITMRPTMETFPHLYYQQTRPLKTVSGFLQTKKKWYSNVFDGFSSYFEKK